MTCPSRSGSAGRSGTGCWRESTEPYPVAVPRTHSLRDVRDTWGELAAGEETDAVVSVTGRVVFIRNTGKLCFATLQEGLR